MTQEIQQIHYKGKSFLFQVDSLQTVAYHSTEAGTQILEEAVEITRSELHLFLIPSGILAAATLLLSPLLLTTILLKKELRQETCYLLFANIVFSDLVYVLFHMLISTSSISGWVIGCIACGVMTDIVFICYTSTILTFTAMVGDAYLAIAFPLRYLSFLTPSTMKKIVALIWVVAFFFPTFLIWFCKRMDTQTLGIPMPCVLQLNLSSYPRNNHPQPSTSSSS
ncbi:probable G-protein coupled receptor 148 [Ornithorhynchus anatinus]|uniref:probable G-protein coupled receptor 148 n=1 Tax=Ornithorhynchus anatinus TaxID=9258 RepID=UPI0004549563|nr:probable G-protein coupled receptor 148 [Ornithorhynchus anatinus]